MTMENTSVTGPWDKDGHFNEKRFEELKEKGYFQQALSVEQVRRFFIDPNSLMDERKKMCNNEDLSCATYVLESGKSI